jgi:tRNA G46 methylase TrmB
LECSANIDVLSTTLKSQIDSLVAERTQHRLSRCYEVADEILSQLKFQYNVEVIDSPFKSGGQSTWRHIPPPLAFTDINVKNVISDNVMEVEENLMMMARNAYVQMKSGEISEASIVEKCSHILRSAEHKKFMDSSIISEMQGRKFADAAFDFSLAGVTSAELYDLLLRGATTEMVRYGHRKSCRAVDILQVVERLAVAGVIDQNFFRLAAEKLQHKVIHRELQESGPFAAVISRLSSGNFNLFSDMPLIWLWRFSARQRKHGNQVNSNVDERQINPCEGDASVAVEAKYGSDDTKGNPLTLPVFDDPSLPLIIDIGCGFGVSMLGLSHREKTVALNSIDPKQSYTDLGRSASRSRGHNFFACDMSHRAVGYATGISKRWDMHGYCKFIESDAVEFLDLIIREYQGPVECVLINFPTPYRFGTDSVPLYLNTTSEGDKGVSEGANVSGNSQLPSLNDFMVSPLVIELCRKALNKKQVLNSTHSSAISNDQEATNSAKYIIIQSNVEDVAITMQKGVTESLLFNESGGFYAPTDLSQLNQISKNWNYSPVKDLNFLPDSSLETVSDVASQDIGDPDHLDNTININVSSLEDSALSDNAQESQLLQKRAEKWIMSGGARARGTGWLTASPLPKVARTETDAMCEHYNRPVHRFLFLLKE